MAKDAGFKTLFGEQIKNIISFMENISVGKLPLEIDFILENVTQKVHRILTTNGFYSLTKISVISKLECFIAEYKSKNDIIRKNDLYKIRGYNGLFISKNWPKYDDRNLGTIFIITDLPIKIRDVIDLFKIDNGIYSGNFGVTMYFIVINELDIHPKNKWFLAFSSGETLKKLLVHFQKHDISDEESLLSVIVQYDLKEVSKMAEQVGYKIPENIRENRKKILEIIGTDEVIQTIGTDEGI